QHAASSRVQLGTHTCLLFFYNPTPTTEIYTLSLHDALPISGSGIFNEADGGSYSRTGGGTGDGLYNEWTLCDSWSCGAGDATGTDRKSTRLNSSHRTISYAVFCLKKKKKKQRRTTRNRYSAV